METRDVIGLLTEQRDLCRQLKHFSERQTSLITGDNPEQLLAILADRQQLLDRLDVLARRLKPYQQNWREYRATLNNVDGAMADRLIGEVNTLLSAILEKDDADARLLAARKDVTARAITGLNHTKKAEAAYAATGNAGGSTVDWMDE
jgi:FlgN protein